MAQKLIPGLSHDTRIAILQQTDTDEKSPSPESQPTQNSDTAVPVTFSSKPVLQHVVESDLSRNVILHDLKG